MGWPSLALCAWIKPFKPIHWEVPSHCNCLNVSFQSCHFVNTWGIDCPRLHQVVSVSPRGSENGWNTLCGLLKWLFNTCVTHGVLHLFWVWHTMTVTYHARPYPRALWCHDDISLPALLALGSAFLANLWGKSIGDRWISLTKGPVMRSFNFCC